MSFLIALVRVVCTRKIHRKDMVHIPGGTVWDFFTLPTNAMENSQIIYFWEPAIGIFQILVNGIIDTLEKRQEEGIKAAIPCPCIWLFKKLCLPNKNSLNKTHPG